MSAYTIAAFPNGLRAIVATLPSDYASSREGVIERAKVHARLRGEYVDVETNGRQIATCDGAGEVTGYEPAFRVL